MDMKILKKKLQSDKGSTLLMAIFLMFLAIMVSAVVLSTALSSAATVKNDKEGQQAFLTVSSAAELMKDGLEGYERSIVSKPKVSLDITVTDRHGTEIPDPMVSFTASNDKKYNWIYGGEWEDEWFDLKGNQIKHRIQPLVGKTMQVMTWGKSWIDIFGGGDSDEDDPVPEGNFKELLDAATDQCFRNINGKFNSKFTISMGDEMEDVKVDFTMKTKQVDEEEYGDPENPLKKVTTQYDVRAMFSLAEESDHNCYMNLSSSMVQVKLFDKDGYEIRSDSPIQSNPTVEEYNYYVTLREQKGSDGSMGVSYDYGNDGYLYNIVVTTTTLYRWNQIECSDTHITRGNGGVS